MDVRGYLAGVTAAVIGGEMLLMLLPEGPLKRFSRAAVGITVALMLILPVTELIR